MSITSSRRRALVVATALAAAATCGIAMAGPTAAAPSAVTASTPVPSDFPDGMLMSYVINTKANPGQVRLAERAVAAAGGVVVQSWPQIGVVVAHSDRANFRTAVKDNGKNAIESIGATRTASVTEGTPEGIQTPWGPGAAAYKKGAKKPANGDLPGEIAPGASAGDPLENAQWDKVLIKADQARKITEGNRNVLVGVLDSGIEADHPDLAANIDVDTSVNCTAAGRPDTSATGWQPTTSTHGTHVAGIIAAAHNGVGLVGVAPNVRMASVKVVNDDGYIYPEYAICGFVWAGMQKMDLTNNSYYVDPFEFWCDDQPDQAAAKEAVRRAVAWSRGQGVAHVAAAGLRPVEQDDRLGQPQRHHAGHATDQRGLPGHPDRAAGRRDGVLAPAVARRCQRQPFVGLQQQGPGRHRRRRARFAHCLHGPGRWLRLPERYLDGQPERCWRHGAAQVDAPDVGSGPARGGPL